MRCNTLISTNRFIWFSISLVTSRVDCWRRYRPRSGRASAVLHYEKNRVGAIMEFEVITVRPDVTLEVVQRYLRRLGKMPENTDKLFVTDRNKVLVGELTLTCILLNDVQRKVSEVMEDDPLTFSPEDIAEHAARTLNVTTGQCRGR